MTDKEKIQELIEKRYEYWKEKEFNSHSTESEIRMSECQHLLLMIDYLQEDLSFHCGDCIKWKDGKGCTLEAENTHCITDDACSEGVEKSKQEEPVDVGTPLMACTKLNSIELCGHYMYY